MLLCNKNIINMIHYKLKHKYYIISDDTLLMNIYNDKLLFIYYFLLIHIC